MKIGTASTRRAIDRWESRARAETAKFRSKGLASAARIIVSRRRGRILLVSLLIVTLSLNFAAVELLVLMVTGFLIAKLRCYRFINSVVKLLPFTR